jgi:dCMP deaminase
MRISQDLLLSGAARERLREYQALRDEARLESRDSWDTFFIRQAFDAAKRSHDASTQVGAVLVRDHQVIAQGYNGFPRDIDDRYLPNVRDPNGHKYQWMIHSEINTLLNAARAGNSTKDTVLYCTHKPCSQCTLFLWQAGVKEAVFPKDAELKNKYHNEEYDTLFEIFQFVAGGRLKFRELDLSGVLYSSGSE